MLGLGQCFSLRGKVVWRSLSGDETSIASGQIIPNLIARDCRCVLSQSGHATQDEYYDMDK
jgi:hypothetical protein